MWKFFKKYGVLIVPGTLFAIVSIDIINKPTHRELLEERWPGFGTLPQCFSVLLSNKPYS